MLNDDDDATTGELNITASDNNTLICKSWWMLHAVSFTHPNIKTLICRQLAKRGSININDVTLPASLEVFICSNNGLITIPNKLPPTLRYITCAQNKITRLADVLPANLSGLKCNENLLTAAGMPDLPPGLRNFYCDNNKLERLPALPSGLLRLSCSGNQLRDLPLWTRGHDALTRLICNNNQITQLPPILPECLEVLECANNQLTRLPAKLPKGLTKLDCSKNQIMKLPNGLPLGLTILFCEENSLNELPDLPLGLLKLNVAKNPLYIIPDLPLNLLYLNIAKCDDVIKYYMPMFVRYFCNIRAAVRETRITNALNRYFEDADDTRKFILAINNMNEQHAIARCTSRMRIINKADAIAEAYWRREMHPSRFKPLLDDADLDVDDFMEQHIKWL